MKIDQSETVGVVIPTYNRAEATLKAVNSVLNQSFPAASIVVVDDGSDEAEFLKLENYLQYLPVSLIRSIHKSNPATMRNLGLAQLKTKWVAFLDSDDLWFENKLEAQITLAIKSGAKAICSNAIRLSTQEKYFPSVSNKFLRLNELIKRNQIINSSVFIERQILMKVGGYVSTYNSRVIAEDYATWLRIATITNWNYSTEPLLIYNDTSVDGLSNIAKTSSINISLTALVDFIVWKNSNKKKKRRLVNYAFRILAKL